MARKPRIEYNGAFYHVITRGNQKQITFRKISDFKKYLNLLIAYKKRYYFRLYAYVLMKNHVHLLIETRETPLSKILQGISQSYTMYFNRKYKTVGHLFQGRYKAILCDRDRYLLALLKYIHYNPVRAQIVQSPGKYRWSSYGTYLAKVDSDILVDIDQVLEMFSEKKSKARRYYEMFMNERAGVPKEDVYATVDQRILGDEKFVEEVARKSGGDVRKGRRKKEYTLAQIAAGIEKHSQMTLDQMRSWSRAAGVLMGRRIFSLAAREYGYTGGEIAGYLKKDPAAVTGYLRQREGLRREVEKVAEELEKDWR